jgi:cyanophycinase
VFMLVIMAVIGLTRSSLEVTSPGKADAATENGRPQPCCLMAIGGAEDRTNSCELLQVFSELCGGSCGRIVLITTASGMPAQAFAMCAAAFRRLGICDIRELRLAGHAQADGEQALAVLAQATGVFFTGGDQARLEFLAGSRTNLALRGHVVAGSLVVGGTSAGAAALGQAMILGGFRGDGHGGGNRRA